MRASFRDNPGRLASNLQITHLGPENDLNNPPPWNYVAAVNLQGPREKTLDPHVVQLRFTGLPPLQSLCHWFPSMNIRIRILRITPRFGGVRPTEARKMCDPLQTWNLQEKGSRLEEKLQIVRYPLSVLGEYITGKGIAFGVVLTFFPLLWSASHLSTVPKFPQKNSQRLPTKNSQANEP